MRIPEYHGGEKSVSKLNFKDFDVGVALAFTLHHEHRNRLQQLVTTKALRTPSIGLLEIEDTAK